MSYYLKDIIAIYPLADNVKFPDMNKYLTAEWITKLTSSGFYNTTDILSKIERKYKYNEIGTSDIEQFFDMINQLIDENILEYQMNLISISESYSIQNMDTVDESVAHTVNTDATNLIITNDTPGSKLNIDNIKAGESASNIQYNLDKGSNYTDSTHREATSPLNTTQSNIQAQIDLNNNIQKALNKFIDSLKGAFSIVMEEYYSEV